jgi:hypothetical protein
VSSIVDNAHVVDTFLGHWYPGGSAAIQIYVNDTDHGGGLGWQWLRWRYDGCSLPQLSNGHCIPFKDHLDPRCETPTIDDEEICGPSTLFTAGNLVTNVIFLPMALMDLKENCFAQCVGFIVLMVTSVQFIVQFTLSGLNWGIISWWGTDQDDLFGVVLFNFALVIAIPAWLYERDPHVDVPTVIHVSSGISVVLYICLGLLGHLALPHASHNMLESMVRAPPSVMACISALGNQGQLKLYNGLFVHLFSFSCNVSN